MIIKALGLISIITSGTYFLTGEISIGNTSSVASRNAIPVSNVVLNSDNQNSAVKVLSGLESDILSALISTREAETTNQLIEIDRSVSNLDVGDNPSLIHYKQYWLAFIKYQISIERMRKGRSEDPQKPLEDAIQILKQVKNKDSEIYALLAMASGLNLQFVPRQNILLEIGDVNEALGKALALDPNNIRAFYANAISDFNTPPEYGGGRRSEGLLKQAIGVKETTPKPLAPNWGKDLVAALMVEVMIKNGKLEEARSFLADAKNKYPTSLALQDVELKL